MLDEKGSIFNYGSSPMCGDIYRWLKSYLPKLDIEKYLYRKA